ncbi:MAG: ankyrin repeat domain-containing protein, partial [Proteobacteria bacterium]|nr:ankyrin repeat domain-containing protein [Pseudomonadota bacterium]
LMHITNEKCAQQLIDAGADVNAKDNKGRTPLMLIGGDDNIEALIKAGADVNAKDNDGQTVLMHQMKLSRAHELEDEIIQSLIKAGADIEAKDNQGRTLQDIPSPAE